MSVNNKIMKYCIECGTKLEQKQLNGEGYIPYCPHCETFRFPIFSIGCSMIVMNKEQTKILLIKQYGMEDYILVAGYITQGEDAEQTVVREIQEELGVTPQEIRFNRSHYYPPSNTLMINFRVIFDSEEIHPNHEIDSFQWFPVEEAKKQVRPSSLARDFLVGMLEGSYHFHDSTYGRKNDPYTD